MHRLALIFKVTQEGVVDSLAVALVRIVELELWMVQTSTTLRKGNSAAIKGHVPPH